MRLLFFDRLRFRFFCSLSSLSPHLSLSLHLSLRRRERATTKEDQSVEASPSLIIEKGAQPEKARVSSAAAACFFFLVSLSL